MKKTSTSIVTFRRCMTFALALAGSQAVVADRKWTAGGGSDTDWTNDANWDSGTGTRLFNSQNWTVEDGIVNVSFTNTTTEADNAFFIQSGADAVVFNASSDDAGLDITVPSSGNWWMQNFYVGTDAQNGALTIKGGGYTINGGSLYIGHNGNGNAATGSVTLESGSLTLGNALLVGAGGTGSLTIEGGTLSVDGVIDVANAGTGSFEMSGGTVTASKYMRLGYGANSTATVHISGGELTAGGSTDNKNYYGLMLADSASSTATFTIDGGTAAFIHDSNVGWSGSGTLNIGGTGKVSIGSAAANKWLFMNRQASATGKSTINLSGNGELDICHVRLDNGTGEINFDGGTIHAYANNSYCGGVVIGASENLTVNVKAGGAAFDVTNGVAVSIAEPLLEDADSTGGGLTKTGRGLLALADGNTYTGTTTVEGGVLRLGSGTYTSAAVNRGVLSFAAGQAFSGAVTVAKGGALAIDISGAIDASTVAVDDTITLLTAQSLTLEEGDSLEEAVFLGGPAIEYTLAFENGALVATVTDVSHASSTRKVTAFIAEDAYIDNAAAWSNGTPTDESYDTIIFPADATVTTWKRGWGDDWGNDKTGNHNIDCQTMAIRDATILAQHDVDFNPALDKNHIVGNGTLKLRRLGLERRRAPETTVTVGANITVEIVQTASNTDTWISPCTINGDLRVTTGYTIFNSDITVNGNATFTGEGKDSYITASTATGNTFNGDFIMEGGNFDFKSAVATFGPAARLVLAGGTVSNYGNNIGMTNVVVNGGLYDYTALPGVDGADFHCSLEDGGTVEFVAASDGAITAAGLTAAGGKVVVDASAMSLSEGSTIDLSQIALADGAAFGTDVEVQIAGTSFDWTVSGSTATAGAPDGDNKWIGSNGGDWHEVSNWKYGIPTASQTVEIDADTVITYSVSYSAKAMPVGTLKLANNATLTIKAVRYDGGIYNRIVVGAVEGTGTIVLDRAGLATSAAVTVPESVGIVAVNNGVNDSWIEGNGGTLTIEGSLTVSNYLCTYSTVVVNGDVTVSGKFEDKGTLTLNGNVANAGTIQVNADNTLNFAGAMTGAGELLNNGKLYFSGTMADFTGTVTLNNNDSWFYGNCTGAANAVWNVTSDMHFESTSNTETPATFYMGSIAISAAKRFYLPNAATMALYIGSGYMRGVHFGDSDWHVATKVAKLTIHKVGTGELVSSLYGCPNWVVEAGSLVFETLTSTWHTAFSTDGTYFDTASKEIDSILVKSGAAFGGSTGLTVNSGALVFESGAIFRQTLTREDEEGAYTYAITPFAATGTVVLDGVTVEVEDEYGYLSAALNTDTLPVFPLMTADSFAGRPAGAIAMATAGWSWRPRVNVSTGSLVLRAGLTSEGFRLHIR